MNKLFNYIMSLSIGEKLFLIFFCYGFGYVIGDTLKHLLK